MNRIEEIKERMKQNYGAVADGITDSTGQLQATSDVQYLLSKLETAEEALEEANGKQPAMYDCYDVETGNKIGVSSVKHEFGDDVWFGNDIYNCVASGEILLFRFCV